MTSSGRHPVRLALIGAWVIGTLALALGARALVAHYRTAAGAAATEKAHIGSDILAERLRYLVAELDALSIIVAGQLELPQDRPPRFAASLAASLAAAFTVEDADAQLFAAILLPEGAVVPEAANAQLPAELRHAAGAAPASGAPRMAVIARDDGGSEIYLLRRILGAAGQPLGTLVAMAGHALLPSWQAGDDVALVLLADGTAIQQRPGASAAHLVLGPEHPLRRAAAIDPVGMVTARLAPGGGERIIRYATLPAGGIVAAMALDARRELGLADALGFWLGLGAVCASLLGLAAILTGILFAERRRALADLSRVTRDRQAALLGLAEAQRLQAMGRLAFGIVHDFRNVLQSVRAYIHLIAQNPDNAAEVSRLAAMAERGACSGASVTGRLLALARPEPEEQVTDVKRLLDDLAEILRDTLGQGFLVLTEAPRDLPPVCADQGDLEAVLINLAVNARDAMSAAGGGTVIFAARAQLLSGEAAKGLRLARGAYVRITVQDTGVGMDAATLERAAEPFFTTKPAGSGTGLGLTMAREFAQRAGGTLHIESWAGRGTRVTLWMPQALPAGARGAERAPRMPRMANAM